ncbi:MAG: SDR family NAD(P)-dependent oxidoreductase [Alicyclobacillus sp.]|nr:SDR family NAD(P)-dependent oxidoreductase [Alicyclobacillus sp.]
MAVRGDGKVALITGASSGIGAACAEALAGAGFQLALGARRLDRLQTIAARIEENTGVRPYISELDVTSAASSEAFVNGVMAHFGAVHVLINNAGLAKGRTYVADAMDDADWEIMLNTNVLGLLRMSRLVIRHILASGGGHVVNLGSVAGHDAYAGGSAYCGTKFAVRANTTALRQELLGQPIRVTSVDPGLVETEFSIVRFNGDVEKAKSVYAGIDPLTAEDIADCVLFAVTRPQHVNIDTIVVTSIHQAGSGKVVRRNQ